MLKLASILRENFNENLQGEWKSAADAKGAINNANRTALILSLKTSFCQIALGKWLFAERIKSQQATLVFICHKRKHRLCRRMDGKTMIDIWRIEIKSRL